MGTNFELMKGLMNFSTRMVPSVDGAYGGEVGKTVPHAETVYCYGGEVQENRATCRNYMHIIFVGR